MSAAHRPPPRGWSRASRPRSRLGRPLPAATAAALILSFSLATGPAALASTSSHSVSPAAYVHSVCTTFGNLTREFASLDAASGPGDAETPAEARERVVVLLDRVATEMNSAVTDLRGAGVPRVQNGRRLAALLVQQVVALRSAFARAGHDARALPVSDPHSFERRADAITARIEAAEAKAQRVFGGATNLFNNQTLERAAARDPTCQALRSHPSGSSTT
jgi:hypothetical protein